MTFAEFKLNPTILKALDQCGYKSPTPVQSRSIPDIMAGKDLVASAQTGTGKTAAFVLPALHRISLNKNASGKPRVLILTPTRELANQITVAVGKYGKYLHCNIVSILGGSSYSHQLRGLGKSVDIIVATPGRLLDHMGNRRVDLSQIEILVLDEADRMLDMGFIDDVREIAKATPNSRQTLLFSATIDNNLSHLIQKLLKNPVRVDLSQERIYPKQIKQEVYLVDNTQHKTKLLEHFLTNERIYKAIIFSATKINADNLAKQLSKDGLRAAALHGDLKQGARNRTIEQFRRGKIQYLVATDVASRGIDVHDITHVINYDIPRFFEDYVHRIGRTGRAGKSGVAITFASPSDTRHLQQIERFIKQKLEILTIPGLEPTTRRSSGGFKKDRSEGGGRKERHRKNKSRPAKHGYHPHKKDASRRDDDRKSNERRNSREDSGRNDSRRGDSRRDDSRRNDGRRGDSRRDDSRRGDSRRDDSRRDDSRRDDSRRDDSRRNDGRRNDGRRGGARRSDSGTGGTRKPKKARHRKSYHD